MQIQTLLKERVQSHIWPDAQMAMANLIYTLFDYLGTFLNISNNRLYLDNYHIFF